MGLNIENAITAGWDSGGLFVFCKLLVSHDEKFLFFMQVCVYTYIPGFTCTLPPPYSIEQLVNCFRLGLSKKLKWWKGAPSSNALGIGIVVFSFDSSLVHITIF